MTTTDPTPRTYPFSAPDRLRLDPFYAELRKQEPVSRVRLPYGETAWLATRYSDVRTVFADPRFSRAEAAERDEPRARPTQQRTGILTMDPPEHTRLRKLVAKAFTARRVEQLRPRAQRIADDLVGRMRRKGAPLDLVEEFALPLPITVICELLGVPYEDRDDFRVWSDAFLSTSKLSEQQIEDYVAQMRAYMAGLVEQRRARPEDDLLSGLIQARDEQDKLSETELLDLAVGLLVAGHETTATQIPNFVYVLLTHPAELEWLRNHSERVPEAVEELMRFVPLGVNAAFPRYALEDVELGGVLVRAGEPVLASLASANRDEEVFERPEELNLARESNAHIGFGHGPHHCLGAQLARMELQVALGTLLGELPELRLGVAEQDVSWKSGMLVRGPQRLPVAWQAG
ncbi:MULTISPECIES: cytochrome P450 [unclassified Actinopolyspora]|uniref:cytochrome P450 n=1 Tax=unclassified Actinopolyspora TaxID=2639451 RepID=UPI0013F67A87|nr:MULTISPECIES: cytochrome P450 [unclassified Actinopolyspora]NHD18464.1 cytochrome P450 [Actinopolyspora sp. BKK2]NHE77577.1 cytochrome P450 [Actinopolyspora sp. BKK1]